VILQGIAAQLLFHTGSFPFARGDARFRGFVVTISQRQMRANLAPPLIDP